MTIGKKPVHSAAQSARAKACMAEPASTPETRDFDDEDRGFGEFDDISPEEEALMLKRALEAKEEGFIGPEESKKLMETLANAEG